MTGTCKINDELAYLVGCGLEQHGSVLMDAVERGRPMNFDDDTDLAIVLTGALRGSLDFQLN